MIERTAAERLMARSRAVTIVALAALALLAWLWLLGGGGMSPAAMPMDRMAAMTWDLRRWLLVIAMWWVMMVAMMLPSAAPLVLLYGRVHRHGGTAAPTAFFLAGYLAAWLGFALLAALVHGQLEQRGIVSATGMTLPSGWPTAGVLIAVGLYQWSRLKDACLANCRSPADFLTRHYRAGRSGALRLGVIHGAYCIGCCWLLMALLFVGGVMNLAWIAALALLVAAEKLVPRGRWIARISGTLMIGAGIAALAF